MRKWQTVKTEPGYHTWKMELEGGYFGILSYSYSNSSATVEIYREGDDWQSPYIPYVAKLWSPAGKELNLFTARDWATEEVDNYFKKEC